MAPGDVLSYRVCIDPPVVAPVTVISSVYHGSGFHDQDSPPDLNRPTGTDASGYTDPAGCWDGQWKVSSNPEYSYVAGGYRITAYVQGAWNEPYLDITVAVHNPWLQWLPNHSAYRKEGATPQHQVNFYGTVNAIYQIQQIAFAWKAETGLTHVVNDISLPMGGVFDLGPTYGGCPFWRPTRPGETNCGHQTHMLGLNADIPYSSLGTQQQRERNRQIAVERQANPLAESDHFHLHFSY